MRTINEQLKESGLQVQFYAKDGFNEVEQLNAQEFSLISWDPFVIYRGAMPKRKAFDLSYVLEFWDKKQKVTHIDYRKIFAGLTLPNVGYYLASYGVGIEVIFGNREQTIKTIQEHLTGLGIQYTNEYSEAHWVYRFKFSKSEANINRILELTNQID